MLDFTDLSDLIGLAGGLNFGVGPGQATFVEANDLGLGGNPADSALIISDGLGGFLEVLALIEGVDFSDLDVTDIVILP